MVTPFSVTTCQLLRWLLDWAAETLQSVTFGLTPA